jgi:hypothetical protein
MRSPLWTVGRLARVLHYGDTLKDAIRLIMLTRILVSSLAAALALTTAGLPLCVGMGMDAGPRAAVDHYYGAGECSDEAGDAPRRGTSMPEPGCCVLGPAAGPRLPAQPLAASGSSFSLSPPAASAVPVALAVPVRSPILSSTGPPTSPSSARHLLLCVFRI